MICLSRKRGKVYFWTQKELGVDQTYSSIEHCSFPLPSTHQRLQQPTVKQFSPLPFWKLQDTIQYNYIPTLLPSFNTTTIQLYCQVSIQSRWECLVIILTFVLDLNSEQRLPLSVGHRHLIKASSSWGCHVVNSHDAHGDVECVSFLSTKPHQCNAVIVSLWSADVRCWRSQKGEREAVGNGIRSDVKGDKHRLVPEADSWNHCVAATRFACFWQ